VLRSNVLFPYSQNNHAIFTTVEDACYANKDFSGVLIFDIKHYVAVKKNSIYGLFCKKCSSIHKLADYKDFLSTYSLE